MNTATGSPQRTSPLLIALAWLFVVLPTGWGLRYTVQNALKLFTAPTPATASPTPPPVH